MNSAQLKRAKRRIRREVLAARDGIPAARRELAGERVAERLLSLPEVEAAGTVMLFWTFGSEVPTAPMIERLHERGVAVALPRIEDGELVPIRYAPGEPTHETYFGAREPSNGEAIEPTTIDVVVVPGLAFDRRGRRIGYGGGYYDRFLHAVGRWQPGATRPFTASPAFAVQVLDVDLPAGHFDLPVDAIVTEEETIRAST
jgi:5-formyltetrahydrofolate cyclo-ligase